MLFLNTFINTKQNCISVFISVLTAFYNNLPRITFATKLYKILKIKGGLGGHVHKCSLCEKYKTIGPD